MVIFVNYKWQCNHHNKISKRLFVLNEKSIASLSRSFQKSDNNFNFFYLNIIAK